MTLRCIGDGNDWSLEQKQLSCRRLSNSCLLENCFLSVVMSGSHRLLQILWSGIVCFRTVDRIESLMTSLRADDILLLKWSHIIWVRTYLSTKGRRKWTHDFEWEKKKSKPISFFNVVLGSFEIFNPVFHTRFTPGERMGRHQPFS